LTGKYRRGAEAPAGSRFAPGSFWLRGREGDSNISEDPRIDLVEQLVAVAEQAGLTMTQMSLAFVDHHPAVTSTIIGPKTPEQLEPLLESADVVLDADTLDAIDAIVPPGVDAPGIGHFVDNPGMSKSRRRR
jgi:aryl-alcohol dehydrogenase (NADP+)